MIDRSKLNSKQAAELFWGSVLLFYVGLFTRVLIVSGLLNLYINPRFNVLSDLTSWICVIMGLVGIVYALQVLRPGLLEGFNLKHSAKNWAKWLLAVPPTVALFLLATTLLVPTTLSPRMAQQRVGGLSTTLEPVNISIAQKWIDNTDNYDIGEWVKLFASEPDPATYAGRSMRSNGFIYHDESMPADQFLLGRFIVRCCVVDATPVGLMVLAPGWQNEFQAGQWLHIEGEFAALDSDEGQSIIVEPEKMEVTEVPVNPYLY